MLGIESIGLFKDLSVDTASALAEAFTRVSYAKNSSFVLEGDAGHRVYVLLSGLCRVWCVSPEGREVTFEILGPGSLIGELSVAPDSSRSASVESLDHATLLVSDSARFREILLRDPQLALRVIEVLSHRLRVANTRIVALACASARQRVLESLLHLAEDHGRADSAGAVTIPFRLTQSDIAKIAGVSRETCAGVMQELRGKNAVRRVDGGMRLEVNSLSRMI